MAKEEGGGGEEKRGVVATKEGGVRISCPSRVHGNTVLCKCVIQAAKSNKILHIMWKNKLVEVP